LGEEEVFKGVVVFNSCTTISQRCCSATPKNKPSYISPSDNYAVFFTGSDMGFGAEHRHKFLEVLFLLCLLFLFFVSISI